MNMHLICRTIQCISLLLALVVGTSGFGQQELIPLWEHTWPFGQAGQQESNPALANNHVIVDPITGMVHCTINDDLYSISEMGDLLYKFTPDGTGITGTPSTVGHWRSGGLFFNENSTTAISIVDDHLFAHQYIPALPEGTTGNMVVGGPLDSTKWVFAHRNPTGMIMGTELIASDGSYVLYSGQQMLYCTTVDGWYVWHKYLSANALTIHEGIAYVAVNNEILRIQVSDGAELSSIPGPMGSFVYLRIDETSHLYSAVQPDGYGPIEVSKRTLDGPQVWEATIENNEGHHLYGLTIDGSGRAWVLKSSPPWDPLTAADSHLWVINGTENHGPYIYHQRINSVTSDADHIYLTGRIDTLTTATFLAAIGAQLITNQAEQRLDTYFSLNPNPATNRINLSGNIDTEDIDLLDGKGRLLATFNLSPSRSISVEGLQNGIYFLRVNAIARRFVIMR